MFLQKALLLFKIKRKNNFLNERSVVPLTLMFIVFLMYCTESSCTCEK